MQTEFQLITSQEPDLFQERLNRFVAALGANVAIGEILFSTVALPGGGVQFSALVPFKAVETWNE